MIPQDTSHDLGQVELIHVDAVIGTVMSICNEVEFVQNFITFSEVDSCYMLYGCCLKSILRFSVLPAPSDYPLVLEFWIALRGLARLRFGP